MNVPISIITITYNNIDGIRKTMESVLTSQKNFPVEWIVVDGGSSDGTDRYIESYQSILIENSIYLVYRNEKDQGRYDGMNKGIDKMSGKWCIFLNAGDSFCFANTLSRFWNYTCGVEDPAEIIYGDAVLERNGRYKYAKAPDVEDLDFRGSNPICHQSCMIRSDIMRAYKYDLNYKYAADYDFLAKIYKEGAKFRHINIPVALYDKSGFSSSNTFAVRREFARVSFRYGFINEDEYKTILSGGKGIKRIIRRIVPESILLSLINGIGNRGQEEWNTSLENACGRTQL